MKKIGLFAVITAVFCMHISCSKLEIPDNDDNTPVSEEKAPSKYVPYQTVYIKVPEGNKSMVYSGGTLVATCFQSGYVVLPKVKAESKSDLPDYQIVNIPAEPDPGVASENILDMVVAFEDTKNGDHDYNDLVFQAHMKISNPVSGGSTVDVDITPVAMGATLTLGLGVVFTDSEGHILSDQLITSNCRTFFFKGDDGFINTGNTRKHYDPYHGHFVPGSSGCSHRCIMVSCFSGKETVCVQLFPRLS